METELFGLSQFRGISYEECGLIVQYRGILRVVGVRNSAKNQRDNYRISSTTIDAVAKCVKEGGRIVGFVHTHLSHHSSQPSRTDLLGAAKNPGALHAVYKPDTGELTWYDASGPRTREGT